MDKEVKLFSESKCQLGEGGCWHRQRESFFWVDILEGRVFEKSLQGDARHWDLNCFTSAVFEIENDSENLWVLSDKGLL